MCDSGVLQLKTRSIIHSIDIDTKLNTNFRILATTLPNPLYGEEYYGLSVYRLDPCFAKETPWSVDHATSLAVELVAYAMKKSLLFR